MGGAARLIALCILGNLKTCTVKFFIVYLEISAEIIMNNKETMQEI